MLYKVFIHKTTMINAFISKNHEMFNVELLTYQITISLFT